MQKTNILNKYETAGISGCSFINKNIILRMYSQNFYYTYFCGGFLVSTVKSKGGCHELAR